MWSGGTALTRATWKPEGEGARGRACTQRARKGDRMAPAEDKLSLLDPPWRLPASLNHSPTLQHASDRAAGNPEDPGRFLALSPGRFDHPEPMPPLGPGHRI